MLRRRQKFTTAFASLALGVAPLGLLAQDTFCPPAGQFCPPGFYSPQPNNGQSTAPPPATRPSQPTPSDQTPSSPSTPQTPGRAQLDDQPSNSNQPQDAPQQQDTQQQQNAPQQPQTATPTFNPSVGSQASTAATSPQATAPNMIGDLFGTGDTQTVIIQPAAFLQTPDPVAVSFLPQSELVSFLPFGTSTPSSVAPNVEFDTVANMFTGTDHDLGIPVSQPISPATFVSQDTTAMIGVVTEHVGPPPNLLTNPPAAGTFFELDQGTGAYQADVTAFYLATKPGLADQQATYIAVNGQGTFYDQVGESVTIGNAIAILNSDGGIVGVIEPGDTYYHQQVNEYDPGDFMFQPVDILYLPPPTILHIPNLGGLPGANVGRQKLTENTSPLPNDRVFVNYSHFAGTPLAAGGVDVNRVTPGFEKTFFDNLMSIEMRAPFASTIGSDFTTGEFGNTNETEFGNMAIWWKTLLWQDCTKSIAAGVGASIPTADDVVVRDTNGTNILAVDNKSTHFLPYVGGVWTPEPRMFISGICQFDIDTGGNSARLSSYVLGQPTGQLQDVGNPDDADYLFVDVQFGYWMYQNRCGNGLLRGFAPIVELHYNRAIDDADDVIATVNGTSITAVSTQQTDLFNGLVGATALITDNASLTMAYSMPIGNNDAQFDDELRVSFNWFFGGPRNGSGTNFRGLALTR